jgi:hypothetical protein
MMTWACGLWSDVAGGAEYMQAALQPSGVLDTAWLLPDLWKLVADYAVQRGGVPSIF